MKVVTLFTLAVMTLGLPSIANAADGTPLWTNVYNGSGNSDDAPRAIAMDTNGNIFVSGYATPSVINGHDFATIKYSSAGVPVWPRTLNGTGSGTDEACAVAVDTSGNVYVAGTSQGSGTGGDFLMIKYSNSGTLLWQRRYDSTNSSNLSNNDIANAMAVDVDGEIYVAGESISNGDSDWKVVKYATDGTFLWARSYAGAGGSLDQANALATDSSDGVYVTGYTTGAAGNRDFTTVRYSSGGTLLWLCSFNGKSNGDDVAKALALDSDGSAYVTGYSYGTSSFDFATIKYSSAGVGLWTNTFNGAGNSEDNAVAIVLDTNKNVYVTGTSVGTGGSSGCVTIKYSTGGVPLWTNYFNGIGNSGGQADGLAVDAGGNVYMAGTLSGGVSSNRCVTIKYSITGTPVWTNFFNNGSAGAIAADSSGNVYVAGGSGDFVTIKYSAPPAPFYFVTNSGNASMSGNKYVLSLVGPAGSNAVISATTNLKSWTPIATNLLPNSTLQITDTLSTNFSGRFYRAQLQ